MGVPAAETPAQFLQDAERRLEMHVLHRIPLLLADYVQRTVPHIASIVNQNMDVAESVQRGADKTRREVSVRHIAGNGYGLAGIADSLGRSLGGVGIEIIDDKPR